MFLSVYIQGNTNTSDSEKNKISITITFYIFEVYTKLQITDYLIHYQRNEKSLFFKM